MSREQDIRALIAKFVSSPDGDEARFGEAIKFYADGTSDRELFSVLDDTLDGLEMALINFRKRFIEIRREARQVEVQITPYENLQGSDTVIDYDKLIDLTFDYSDKVRIGDSTGEWEIPAERLEPFGMWIVHNNVDCKILGLVQRKGNVSTRLL